MQNDILFDNIYLGHSIEDAIKFKNETFDLKIKAERAEEEASKPPEPELPKSPNDLKFMDDPALYIKEKSNLFLELVKRDPVQAVKMVPEVPGAIVAVLVLLITIVGGVLGGGAAPSKDQLKKGAQKAKDAAADAKDKAAEAVSTGTEKAQEATKRATRSSTQS
jgi:calnexin